MTSGDACTESTWSIRSIMSIMSIESKIGMKTAFFNMCMIAAVLACGGAQAGPFAEKVAAIDVAENLAAIKAAGKAALPDLLAAADSSKRKDLLTLAIGFAGDPQALPVLEKLAAIPDVDVRANAAWALGRTNSPKAVPLLVKLIEESRATPGGQFIRQAAMVSLAAMPGPESLDACVKAVGDPDPDVRRAAITAIGKSGRKDTWRHLQPFLDYEMVEEQVDDAPDGRKPGNEPPKLVVQWRDPDPTLRYAAIEAINELRCIDAVPALATAMEREDSFNRLACVQAILNVGQAAAGVCLGRIVPISYEQKEVEQYWPEAINNGTLAVIAGKLGDERCVPHLRNTLRLPMRNLGNDKDLTELVIDSVRLLGTFKVEREAKRLAGMLKTCRIRQLSDALAEALTQIGPAAARHVARNLDDWQTAPVMLELLRREVFWTDEARDQLAAYLTHESDDVRRAATETFGLYLAKHVIEIYDYPLLKAQLLDPDPVARECAENWLKQLGDVE